jgi:hypothetical protein
LELKKATVVFGREKFREMDFGWAMQFKKLKARLKSEVKLLK